MSRTSLTSAVDGGKEYSEGRGSLERMQPSLNKPTSFSGVHLEAVTPPTSQYTQSHTGTHTYQKHMHTNTLKYVNSGLWGTRISPHFPFL